MKIVYDTKECGRCAGCGRYSYNQIDGDRCYGCGGSGKVLTPQAKRVKARVVAERESFCRVSPPELKVGDVIEVSSMRGRRWEKVTSIESADRTYVNPEGGYFPAWTIWTNGQGLTTRGTVLRQPTPTEFAERLAPIARRAKNGAKVIDD